MRSIRWPEKIQSVWCECWRRRIPVAAEQYLAQPGRIAFALANQLDAKVVSANGPVGLCVAVTHATFESRPEAASRLRRWN